MTDDHSHRCKNCVVRDTSLCASLCDSELAALSEIARSKIVSKGSVVTWAGDDNAMCANLVSGAIKLLQSTSDGREQTVGLLFAGDFVGQPFANSNPITAVALTDIELCVYSRALFERALVDNPRLQRALLERTMLSLNEARDRQLTLARKSAPARVAGFLLSLSRAENPNDLVLPMSRGDIADFLGLTIETVSRQFTELKCAGLIGFQRGGRSVKIVNRGALQSISED